METVNYSEARKNFAAIMNKTNDDKAPLLITRGGGKPCVLIAFDEYEALEETAYLLRSPANARHLQESIADLDAGRGKERALLE
ncbi:antitoxin [Betaproteobacteria bacterium]|nr:antitoxin [Betaproteobacteria bacterium]GHU14310.1 antitoxin [Betaproteobacteria bacterium]GHU47614.1 antitoxin [Betaproteobacteria bacterium]